MRSSRIVLCLCLLLYPAMHLCSAATFSCGTSDVACLMASITAANRTPEPDTIRLAAGTYTLTAVDNTTNGRNGLPSVTSPLTILGAGDDTTTLERAASAPNFRLVHVAASGDLTLDGVILRGGTVTSVSGADGGGIYNAGGTVIITNSTVTRNSSSPYGGGIYNTGGTVIITNSTVSRNTATVGGGLANVSPTPTPSGTVVITNSTFAGNLANEGAGILNSNAAMSLTNTTVAGNGSGSFYDWALLNFGGSVELLNTLFAQNRNTIFLNPGCGDPLTSLGHNLFGDPMKCAIALQPTDRTVDPGVGEFTDDGTPGNGHYPLLATSRALDAGNPFTCPTTDQLGHPRSGPCDIGAVEFQPVLPPALTLTLNQSRFMAGETVRVALHVQQPGPTFTGDFYFGALLPDGQTALFISNEGWIQARLDNPRAFRPLATHAVLAQGLDLTFDPFFAYTFNGGEPSGIYSFFALVTPPDAFSDGRIDAGDFLALEVRSFRFSPSGLVAQLTR